MPSKTQKSCFRIGEVAFFKVSSTCKIVSKKVPKAIQNEQKNVPKVNEHEVKMGQQVAMMALHHSELPMWCKSVKRAKALMHYLSWRGNIAGPHRRATSELATHDVLTRDFPRQYSITIKESPAQLD